jgi:GTP-binding protein HflX
MIAVDRDGTTSLGELEDLLRTAGVAAIGEAVQRRSEPDPDRYFGRGRLEDLKAEIASSGANLVACDDELAPRQERNLERFLGVPVIDRTAIILDIFASQARSSEGKLQVELSRAARRRHRNEGPGRIADRDRSPSGS